MTIHHLRLTISIKGAASPMIMSPLREQPESNAWLVRAQRPNPCGSSRGFCSNYTAVELPLPNPPSSIPLQVLPWEYFPRNLVHINLCYRSVSWDQTNLAGYKENMPTKITYTSFVNSKTWIGRLGKVSLLPSFNWDFKFLNISMDSWTLAQRCGNP